MQLHIKSVSHLNKLHKNGKTKETLRFVGLVSFWKSSLHSPTTTKSLLSLMWTVLHIFKLRPIPLACDEQYLINSTHVWCMSKFGACQCQERESWRERSKPSDRHRRTSQMAGAPNSIISPHVRCILVSSLMLVSKWKCVTLWFFKIKGLGHAHQYGPF